MFGFFQCWVFPCHAQFGPLRCPARPLHMGCGLHETRLACVCRASPARSVRAGAPIGQRDGAGGREGARKTSAQRARPKHRTVRPVRHRERLRGLVMRLRTCIRGLSEPRALQRRMRSNRAEGGHGRAGGRRARPVFGMLGMLGMLGFFPCGVFPCHTRSLDPSACPFFFPSLRFLYNFL